jgi:hypothetical protein
MAGKTQNEGGDASRVARPLTALTGLVAAADRTDGEVLRRLETAASLR